MFKEIADYLLNIDKEKATGLLVGNAGVSLFLYQVYRKTGQTEFEETADIMLNNILEKQTMLSSTNFRDGLAGIGWGIEFLLQNNFYEGDPEEILEDVDNVIFKSTLNPQLHSRSATYIKRNGLLIRKITIKSSRPFQCAYHPLTP